MKSFRWPCHVLGVYDGDTVTLDLDLGFSLTKRISCRLDGIDTPELRRARGIPDHDVALFKRAGILARDQLRSWVIVEDLDWESMTLDKYGRSLGVLWPRGVNADNGISVNQRLIEAHLAVPYDGGARSSRAHISLHRKNIEQLIKDGDLTP